MLNVNVEERVKVKLCVELGKSATETYDLLKKVYGDECLSHTQVFEWLTRFKEGREEIGDDQSPGRPSTSKTEANIEKIGEIVRQNRRLSIQAVAELINIDKETVRHILRNNLNMKKNVFEDGAKTPHSWTKGNSNEQLCWHSSKHRKQPELLTERNNL